MTTKAGCRIVGLRGERHLHLLRAPILFGLFLACSIATAQAPSEIPLADRTFLERLALARARTKLMEQIYNLPLDGELTVGRWIAENPVRERTFRQWARTVPRTGPVRIYSDASCDVEVHLTPADLAAKLSDLRSADGEKPATTSMPADFENAVASWTDMWCCGTSMLSEKVPSQKPVGWEDVGLEGVSLAEQAAVADAIHALLEKAGGLRVTAAKRLKAFLDTNGIYDPVYQAVKTAAKATVETPPEQVAIAQVEIGMTDFIRILTDVHQAYYKDNDFHAPDFREMALNASQPRLDAVGVAVPPERYRLRETYSLIDLDKPAWVDSILSAEGSYVRQPGEQFKPEECVELARVDGCDVLRRKIEALVVQDKVTVEQFLGFHPELKADVVVFLSGARLHGPPKEASEDKVTVQVDLPLERLWRILVRGMERIEVDPPKKAEQAEVGAQG